MNSILPYFFLSCLNTDYESRYRNVLFTIVLLAQDSFLCFHLLNSLYACLNEIGVKSPSLYHWQETASVQKCLCNMNVITYVMMSPVAYP